MNDWFLCCDGFIDEGLLMSRLKKWVYSLRWLCFPVTISYHLFFIRISNVKSMLHHGPVGWAQSKLYVCIYFFAIVSCFSSKNLCFYYFHFFLFDEVWNFYNRILTNQKYEFVIKSCQWNCREGTITEEK